MNLFVVDFEENFALKGIPYFKKEMPHFNIVGLLARNIEPSVHDTYKNLSIYEKKVTLDFLISFSSKERITLDLINYLRPHEEQIHYHINRYFDTSLAFDYSLLKYKVICYVLDMLSGKKVDLVYFGITPHDPVSYVLYLIAKHSKIGTMILSKFHVLNSYILYESIGDQLALFRNETALKDKEAIELIEPSIEDSLKALISKDVGYMIKQKKSTGSVFRKIKHNLLVKKRVSIQGILTYRAKSKIKKNYESKVDIKKIDDMTGDKVIFFPLHYQPEMTTSPDGDIFAQQWLIVKLLVENYGSDYRIVIKEHPSQFLVNTKIVRSTLFYDALLAIDKRVSLASLNINSKDLLNYCSGVATITGTVGFESIMYEKPVLAFGDAKFIGAPGVFLYNETGSIEGYRRVLDGQDSFSTRQVISYFDNLSKSNFMYLFNPTEEHESRHLKAIKYLLSNYYDSFASETPLR